MKALALLFAAGLALAAKTPAELKIDEARGTIDKFPAKAEGYNALALALSRRARETGDTGYYNQVEEALRKSFEAEPDNFEGLKVKTWLYLGRHEFAKALEIATTINKKMPDDVLIYGYLTDANVELGKYDAAEKAAQWMLDLRPGNVPGLTRGAYLRELFGDIDGALEFMNQAFNRTRPEETEDRAWLLTNVAHLMLAKGDVPNAERAANNALKIFPDYHYAVAQLAAVRQEQKRYDDAVELMQKRYKQAALPENLYFIAAALEKAGRKDEAKETFANFETAARAKMNSANNANRELIFYYLDYANNPAEGLKIAKREIGIRQDVYTLDAYAWALYKNGEFSEARKQLDRALAVGLKDKTILEHSVAVSSKVQGAQAAR